VTATAPTLTPLAYRTLSLFAEGMNVAQIAVAAEIAACEARLAKLRQWEAA
jgi:hypothetical protein